MPESKYYMIWESNPDIDDTLREYLAAIYEGLSEEEQDIRFYEDNAERLEDERQNLAHIQSANGILVIGNLGLWSGRHYGILDKTKHPEPVSISDCLQSYVHGDSEIKFYVDEKGEFRASESHHDGTNYYWFRGWRPNISQRQKDNLLVKLCSNPDAREYGLINRYTFRLGDLIGDVYSWKFKYRPRCSTVVF